MALLPSCLLWTMALAFPLAGGRGGDSYLHAMIREGAGPGRHHVEIYEPREGDLLLFNDHKFYWKVLYKLRGSDIPDHSGIIVRLGDGGLATLEAGPNEVDPRHVRLCAARERIKSYPGTIWIRRLKDPLSPEQSSGLTSFAYSKEGQRYAFGRLLLQGTPVRARGALRQKYFGKTDLNRTNWLCSELVVSACVSIGLFDPEQMRANSIYPLDLFHDTDYDLSDRWHPPGLWRPSADPPGPRGR